MTEYNIINFLGFVNCNADSNTVYEYKINFDFMNAQAKTIFYKKT